MKDQEFKLFYGYITRFNPELYTVDVAIFPSGKTITNIPITYLNSFHSYGMSIIPAPNQEVLVIDFKEGPAMILPIITKKYNNTYQGARPTKFDYGDLYFTTPLTRTFHFAKGMISMEVGQLNDAVGKLVLSYDNENELGTFLVKSDIVAIESPSTTIKFGQALDTEDDKVFELKHTVSDKKFTFNLLPSGALNLEIKKANRVNNIIITSEKIQVINDKAQLEFGDNIILTTKDGNEISLSENGKLTLKSQSIDIKANTINIDSQQINVRGQSVDANLSTANIKSGQASLKFDNYQLDTQTASVNARSIIISSNVRINGSLTVSAKIESLSEITVNFDPVVTKNTLRPIINNLYTELVTITNVFNAHTHTLAGPVTLSPIPSLVLTLPRPII